MKHFLYGFIATLLALIILDPEPEKTAESRITLLASIAASESVKLFVVRALFVVEVYRVAKQRKMPTKEKKPATRRK